MGLRITTWNVNGIRNPFGFQPWRDKRTFGAMFDTLQADIVIFQETKIQRKDLTDDMVLVPGWDCFFSHPRVKRGYSGVAIYTRQSRCCPIRAEEGLTGTLDDPSTKVAYKDESSSRQIGGYPSAEQLSQGTIDAATLDSEGRVVVLEFPAFVLIGVYCPANRDETRDDYRLGFLNALDARIRNLIALQKEVIIAGDINISREEIDVANAEASMRKQGITGLEYVSTPARRIFNQLLEGGKVYGDRDPGRGVPVLYDIVRAFHPLRQGMFTCWEQKVNARPANCGARIDYILCSLDLKAWCIEADIQSGLMGSDHCPVYVELSATVPTREGIKHIEDVLNPANMFVGGKRMRELGFQDHLSFSGRLIPEFRGRRNIKDMFSRKIRTADEKAAKVDRSIHAAVLTGQSTTSRSPPLKRPSSSVDSTQKKLRHNGMDETRPGKEGQQTLRNFFKLQSQGTADQRHEGMNGTLTSVGAESQGAAAALPAWAVDDESHTPSSQANGGEEYRQPSEQILARPGSAGHSPPKKKQSWSELFRKPLVPRCEGHDEPCITLLTKKPGRNLGRSFWMCRRPLGPSGAKERNSEWRCQTFIWCSDWNTHAHDSKES